METEYWEASGKRSHLYAHGELSRGAGVFSGISAHFQGNPLLFVSPSDTLMVITTCGHQPPTVQVLGLPCTDHHDGRRRVRNGFSQRTFTEHLL